MDWHTATGPPLSCRGKYVIQDSESNPGEKRALDLYSQRERLASIAVSDVQDRITATLRALGDPHLVRATVEPCRIKSFARLKQKAERFGWTIEEAIDKAQDFIGFRLVCDNLQDVRRASQLIRESLTRDGYKIRKVNDYVAKPKNDGYRAVHVVFEVPVKVGAASATLNCELQIRSRLQNTWAHLSRIDLYSYETQPPRQAVSEMRRLSELLCKADSVADRIRDRIARPRRCRKPIAGQTLTAATLAFVYRRRFSQDPPDYLVQSLLRDYGHLAIRADGLEAALADDPFISQLKDAYKDATRFEWDAEPEQLFRWVLQSMVSGTKSAIATAVRDSRAEADDIERIGRSEALSSVPQTAASFLDELEHPDDDGDFEGDIEQWASALGVLERCSACGQDMVDAYELADAAVRHFKLRGQKAERFREHVRERVSNSAVDPGGWNHSGLCSGCDYMLSKDD
jgi:ppGpp synthetase/RelA/SpoT-type nucleotidyltranferase